MSARLTVPRSGRGTRRPWIRKMGGEFGLRCRSEAPSETLVTRSISRSTGPPLFDRAGDAEPQGLPDLRLQVGEDRRVVLQPLLRVLTPLPDPLVLIGVPGAGLLNDFLLDAGVEDRPG